MTSLSGTIFSAGSRLYFLFPGMRVCRAEALRGDTASRHTKHRVSWFQCWDSPHEMCTNESLPAKCWRAVQRRHWLFSKKLISLICISLSAIQFHSPTLSLTRTQTHTLGILRRKWWTILATFINIISSLGIYDVYSKGPKQTVDQLFIVCIEKHECWGHTCIRCVSSVAAAV